MTLVVARANEAGLRIVTDSRATFTSPDRTPSNPTQGVMKVVVISHSQCIAFAGDVDVAYEALHEVWREGLHLRFSDDAILERLFSAHERSARATEFILGSVIDRPRIHQVRDAE